MILDHEKIGRIRTALKFRPKGMSISEIAQQLKMNRNSVAKYLEILLISGQVEARTIGTSKVYTVSQRIPVSAMMSFSSDMILMIGSDGTILQANDTFLRFSGLTRDEVIGGSFQQVERALFDSISLQDTHSAEEKKTIIVERTTHRNGREYNLRIRIVPTTFDDGNEGQTLIIEDVSEQRQAERALSEREKLYRSVLENIQDVYYRTDLDGNLVMASPSWATMLGYKSLDECLGRNISTDFYLQPEKRKDFLNLINMAGSVFDYEVVLKKKDGTPLYVSTNSHLYYNENGNHLGVEGIFRDISERRSAAEKIHKYIARIEYLSQKLLDFIGMEPGENIFERIASDLHTLVPGAIILVNSFNQETGMVRVERMVMNEAERRIVNDCLGRDPEGLELPIDAVGLASFRSGSLYRANVSLFEIAFRAIPEPVCHDLERNLAIDATYAIGFVRGTEVLGNATFILRSGENIPDSSLLGMYARQASIALQKYSAEEARRKSEEIFVNLARASPLPIAIIDPDGTYRFINQSFTTLFGYDLTDFHNGREWFLLAFPDPAYRQTIITAWKEDLKNSGIGETRNRVCLVRCKDQTAKEIIFRPVTISDGKQCIIYEDVTERKAAEHTRRLLSSIVESTGDAVIGKDVSGRIISWNKAAERLYGYLQEDIIGLHISFIIPPDRRPEMEQILERIRRGEAVSNLETRRIRKDGTVIDVAVTVSPIKDEKGTVIGASTIARGISKLKAEARLRESEEKYRSLVENITVGVYRSTGDPEGRFIWGNPMLVSLLGYRSFEDLKKTKIQDLFVQQDGRMQLLEELKQSGFVRNRRLDLKRADGHPVSVMITALARFDEQGEILCINGLVEDITGQQKAELRVRDMEKEIGDIVDFIPDATFIIDRTGKVIAWNTAMERLYEVPRERVMGRNDYARALSPLAPASSQLIGLIDAPISDIEAHYPNVKQSNGILTAEFQIPAGPAGTAHNIRFSIRAAALNDPQGNRIGAIQTIRSISDIPGRQEHLVLSGLDAPRQKPDGIPGLASLMYLSNALMTTGDCITIIDLSARCIWVNDAFVSLLGAGSSEGIIGKSVARFIATEMRKPVLDHLSDARRHGYALFPLSLITPAGRVPVEAGVSVVADDGGSPLGYMAILRAVEHTGAGWQKPAKDPKKTAEEKERKVRPYYT
jgi:PAS domain S-box-containing protein